MKKKLHSVIVILCLALMFSACQKEYFEEGDFPGGTISGSAVFAFAGSPSNCLNAVVGGFYTAGSAVNSANNVTVQVRVTDTGTYNIVSNTANGITFSATGKLDSTGSQTVVLSASGTPASGGSFNFTLGTGGCTFLITFTGNIPNTGDCKECIYLPFCVGSKYVYTDSVFNPVTGDTSVTERPADFVSATDTTIMGRPYKKLEVLNGVNSAFSYVNCTDGETTIIAYSVQSSTSGNVLLAVKSTDLKANAPIGSTWSDTAVFASGNKLYRKHTIAQKGITRVVLGISYSDVIKVNVVQTAYYVDPPLGLTPAGVTDYYIAKGTGVIETITVAENPFTNENYIAFHSVLKSVFIP